MIKKTFIIFILLFSTTSLFALDAGAKFDFGLYYHPSITLDDSTDLPVYSSLSSTYDFEPIFLKFGNLQFGPYVSVYHVSQSIVFNNEYLRDFKAVAFGLDFGYYFSDSFKFKLKSSLGIGALGESLNKEMYANVALIPSYILKNTDTYNYSLDFIFNLVYRKYLLSPSVGIGFSTSFDWISYYINKKPSNHFYD